MKFTIDRQKWLRGEGSGPSRLYRPSDSKQCCIGMLLEQSGFKLQQLSDIPCVGRLCDFPENRHAMKDDLLWLLTYTEAGKLHNSVEAGDLYGINDNEEIDDAERERLLAEHFNRQDIEVEFIN